MSRKACAVISFGTADADARRTLAGLEQRFQQVFPDYALCRAFTSETVIAKIEQTTGEHIPTPARLMERLAREGYDEVLCQSLHVMPGLEYEKMCRTLAGFQDRFARLAIGAPLLGGADDCETLCRGLMQSMPHSAPDEAYVYMGHGTAHTANAVYAQLERTFHKLGAEQVHIGTMRGCPDLTEIRRRLHMQGVRRITLGFLLLTAGIHVQRDFTQWQAALQADGFTVQIDWHSLGERPIVQELFLRHARAAAQEDENM